MSLNISETLSQRLDRWERATGESRGNLARRAIEAGLPRLRHLFSERIERELAGEPPNTSYRPDALLPEESGSVPARSSD